MEMLYIIYGVVIGFVVSSAAWFFIDIRGVNELEDELDEMQERLEMAETMTKQVIAENRRMLATLNHYNIKKAAPIYPSEEVRRNGRR